MAVYFFVMTLLLDVAAIVDLLGRHAPDVQKLLWILVVLAVPFLGALLYFAVGRHRFET